MATLIKKETVKAILIPESVFIKQKNNKYVYKDKYEEKYYVVYRDITGTRWIVEYWQGGCNC